jgi:hypothetical protein
MCKSFCVRGKRSFIFGRTIKRIIGRNLGNLLKQDSFQLNRGDSTKFKFKGVGPFFLKESYNVLENLDLQSLVEDSLIQYLHYTIGKV